MTRNSGKTLPKGTSDEHYTPKSLFEILGVQFDLDVAAPHGGGNAPAAKYFCKCCADGLEEEWMGSVWMNPPYSNPTPWVEKFIANGYGIALLPITRGRWWDKMWDSADAIVPMPYNYKFERPDGQGSKPILFRTALYAYGSKYVNALNKLNLTIR